MKDNVFGRLMLMCINLEDRNPCLTICYHHIAGHESAIKTKRVYRMMSMSLDEFKFISMSSSHM